VLDDEGLEEVVGRQVVAEMQASPEAVRDGDRVRLVVDDGVDAGRRRGDNLPGARAIRVDQDSRCHRQPLARAPELRDIAERPAALVERLPEAHLVAVRLARGVPVLARRGHHVQVNLLECVFAERVEAVMNRADRAAEVNLPRVGRVDPPLAVPRPQAGTLRPAVRAAELRSLCDARHLLYPSL